MKVKQTELIRYYILTHIDMSEQSMYPQDIGTYEGLLNELMNRFESYAKERRSLGYTALECFATFAGGLPSYFRIDFETYKQKELLRKWGLEETLNFYYVIYCELRDWRVERWRY